MACNWGNLRGSLGLGLRIGLRGQQMNPAQRAINGVLLMLGMGSHDHDDDNDSGNGDDSNYGKDDRMIITMIVMMMTRLEMIVLASLTLTVKVMVRLLTSS